MILFFFIFLFGICYGDDELPEVPPPSESPELPPPVVDIPVPPPVVDIPVPPPEPVPVPVPVPVKPPSCFDIICGPDCDSGELALEAEPNKLMILEEGFTNENCPPPSDMPEIPPPSDMPEVPPPSDAHLVDIPPSDVPLAPVPDAVPVPVPVPVRPPSCFDVICGPGCDSCDLMEGNNLFDFNSRRRLTSNGKTKPLIDRMKDTWVNSPEPTGNQRLVDDQRREFYSGPPIYRPPFVYDPYRRQVARCARCDAFARERARDLALDDLLVKQTILIKRKQLRERERQRERARQAQARKAKLVV